VDEKSKVLLVVTLRSQMAKKLSKHMAITMEYESPHESNTMYKNSHMMVL
jgi:hypothetical protein